MSDRPVQTSSVLAADQAPRADASDAAGTPPRATLGSRLAGRPVLFEALGAAVAAALSLVLSAIALELWAAPDLRLPLVWGGDMPSLLAVIKGIREAGWVYSNPALGAPDGAHLYDFGSLGFDNGSWVVIKAMTLVAESPAAVLNGYFLLGFALIAIAAFLVLRALDVRWGTAIVIAVLFSLLPGHFSRGLSHAILGAYWAVPIGCYLALAVMTGRPLFAARPGRSGLTRWLTRRTLLTFVLCALVASGGIYYAAFTLMMLATAAVAMLFTPERRRAGLTTIAVVTGALLAVMVFNALPTLLYGQANGPNPVVAKRAPSESEIYGLKLTTLLLPAPNHRVGPLADLGLDYGAGTPLPSEGPATPGTFGVLGLLLLAVAIFARVAGGRVRGVLGDRRVAATSLLALVGFMVGTVGGGSAFISFFVSPALRAYNRVSFVLAFLGLLAVAVALDRVRGRIERRGAPLLAAGLLAVVLLVGAFDQTPPANTSVYTAAQYEWGNDARFAAKVSEQLGGRGEVYQLPYMPFPESPPIHSMTDYSPLKPYLHAPPSIEWSYGAMKGRDEDWQDALQAQPFAVQIPAAAAAGFEGLYIDLAAYEDPQPVLAEAQRITGAVPVVSENGRLTFFDLRPLAQRVSPGDDALHASGLTFGEGFHGEESQPGSYQRWMGPRGTFSVRNEASEARPVRIRARLVTQRPATSTLSTGDGRRLQTVRTDRDGAWLDVTTEVPPGEHAFTLTTTAPRYLAPGDPRILHMQVVDYVIADVPIAEDALTAAR